MLSKTHLLATAIAFMIATSGNALAEKYDAAHMLYGRSQSNKSARCKLPYGRSIAPVHYPASGEIENGDSIRLQVERYFTALGIAATTDPEAAKQLKRDLLLWANDNSLSSGNTHNAGDRHRTLLPIIVAYGHNKLQFSADEQAAIENWLSRIVNEIARSGEIRSLPKTHNITYLHGSVQMALGIVTNSDKRIRKAINIYKAGIKGIRTDGSLPDDSERGGAAIHYTNASVASLVTIAELAANQGIDLYSYRADKTLADAVSFLLSATEDPSIILPYAMKDKEEQGYDGEPASDQKRDWIGCENADWAYYWVARFPDSAQTKTILRIVSHVKDNGTGAYAMSGGAAACFVTQ